MSLPRNIQLYLLASLVLAVFFAALAGGLSTALLVLGVWIVLAVAVVPAVMRRQRAS